MKIKFRLESIKKIFDGSSMILGLSKKVTKRALFRFGIYCRKVARNSLGKGTEVSNVGEPPTSRTRMLKNSIRSGVDMNRRSVVIGPVILRVPKKVKGLVPPLLEYGGMTMLLVGKKARQRWRPARYRARPFMGPAFTVSLPRLSRFWQQARQDVFKG